MPLGGGNVVHDGFEFFIPPMKPFCGSISPCLISHRRPTRHEAKAENPAHGGKRIAKAHAALLVCVSVRLGQVVIYRGRIILTDAEKDESFSVRHIAVLQPILDHVFKRLRDHGSGQSVCIVVELLA
jgi:hypothetical protein